MSDEDSGRVRCSFYIREPVDGGYHYESMMIASPQGDGYLHTNYPPAVGDHLHLWDSVKKSGGQYVVLARSWLHSSYGSTNWPYAEPNARVGPLMDIVVEPSGGWMIYEVPTSDEAAVEP